MQSHMPPLNSDFPCTFFHLDPVPCKGPPIKNTKIFQVIPLKLTPLVNDISHKLSQTLCGNGQFIIFLVLSDCLTRGSCSDVYVLFVLRFAEYTKIFKWPDITTHIVTMKLRAVHYFTKCWSVGTLAWNDHLCSILVSDQAIWMVAYGRFVRLH